jgi:outer membrane murein-binding lipoprotein Lpp
MSDREPTIGEVLEAVTQLRVATMARIDRLQTHVDQMADAAFVTYAQGESITTQISGLVRQVRRLTARMDALEGKDG